MHPGVHQTLHDQLGKSHVCHTVLSVDAASSQAPQFKKAWWSFMVSKGGDKQSWWKGWRKCPVRSRGEFWVCLVCRKEGWGITSFLSTVFWDGEITSPRYAVIGLVWVVPSCTRGRFRLVIRKHFFTKRVKDWNRLLREVINAPGLSVFKRHLDNVLNNMF